jgi:hypothetical protein
VQDGQTGDERSYSVSALVTPGGIAISDSEKAEALADTLETQFQPVADPLVPAFIQMFDVALMYFQTPASETKLTNPDEVHEAIRGLKVGKAPGPNGIPNRALKRLHQRAVSLLVRNFNAILLTHYLFLVEARLCDIYP